MADWNWKGNLEDIELDYCFDISSGKYQIVSMLSSKYLKKRCRSKFYLAKYKKKGLWGCLEPKVWLLST